MIVKNNVNSKNSRTVFKKSFLELLDEKYICEISVTELCNRVNNPFRFNIVIKL